MTDDSEAHETGLSAFVSRDGRARFRELLKSPRGRRKLRSELAHFSHLDPTLATEQVGAGRASELVDRLRNLGAGESCYLLAESADLDGKTIRLEDALAAIAAQDHLAAFVSCVPGRLAYFHGEDREQRFILVRTP
jgi:hypothetical protein